MTNSYDVAHGLSQDAPCPLQPVEIAQQPGDAPATGNTARDQEMYAAGIRTGEENAKHNAAIRAAAAPGASTAGNPQPARDWELTCHKCDGSGHVYVKHQVAERKTDIQEFKEECECCEGRGFVFAFRDIPGIEEYVKACRPAPAAPGVSTVEDAPAWPSGLLDRVKAAEKRIRDGHGLMRVPADPTDPDLVLAEIAALIEGRKPPFWLRPAPAAGDAQDAALWRAYAAQFPEISAAFLAMHGTDPLPTIKGAAITGGYVVVTPAGWDADKATKLRDAILRLFPVNPAHTPRPSDELAAQRKGDA
ncbi:hypothetical protein ACOTJ6_13015 [Achromobacter xylosoxidans]|uniref:hypothetical protein n=1 Tax=Alcaligenes xylosoxydans xylosoxydans TaxID=85698 RepID=UPI000479A96F|nr:hypothetical protein [Achromobacter xylosoxidans]